MKAAGADQLLLWGLGLRSGTVMATTKGWKLPVEVICGWRWRCLGEGVSITGSELWFASDNGGGLTRLSENTENFVDRHDLRHDCGSPVLPVHAIEDKC